MRLAPLCRAQRTLKKGNGRAAELGCRLPGQENLFSFRSRVLKWHKIHGRRFPWRERSASNYELVIAEVLLQRTRAETVSEFFPRFINRFPSWRKLRSARVTTLGRFLRPLGLWRRRATSIQRLAKEMARRNGKFPSQREEIEALPGVGQYIANAILLFCHKTPQPLLDVNMARVLERVFGPRKLADIRYDPFLQTLAGKLIHTKTPKELNWAILDFAATICIPRNPHCEDCPIVDICRSTTE